MALDVQTVAMSSDCVPYEKPPDSVTLWTAIPRGIFSMYSRALALDAKAINDEMLLSFTGTLPPNYAYVMAYANMSIAQDEASDWVNLVNLNLQNFMRLNRRGDAFALDGNYVQEFPLNDVIGTGRAISVINPWPTFPMVTPPGGAGVQINFSTGNAGAPATLLGVAHAYIAFWQFDLEQIRKFPVNSPIPVHSR